MSTQPKKPHNVQDTAWKDIVDIYLPDFIQFCLPNLNELIDWDKPWSSLDKELHAITKDGQTGTRIVDKLMSTYFKDGSNQWFLIHIELQSNRKTEFPERMFIYSNRIFDKYRTPIYSCAILTDEDINWRPSYYEVKLLESCLRIDYKVIKLTDYHGQEELLEASSNPFATVILSYLEVLTVKKSSDDLRYRMKLMVTRRLYEKRFRKQDIVNIYKFIDWLLHLPEELELKYQDSIYQIEVEKDMPYISTIERFGHERGMQQGLQQGREEGRQEGHQEGRQEGIHVGEVIMISTLIKQRFHHIAPSYQKRIEQADVETLLRWAKRLLEVKSLEEIFEED